MRPQEIRHVYHASSRSDLDLIIPRKRATPAVEMGRSPPRVYAGDNPAYAAAHGIPWATAEGFLLLADLDEQGEGYVEFGVPRDLMQRLDQPVCIYCLPREGFERLVGVEPEGHNFASTNIVMPLARQAFPSVCAAIKCCGGVVRPY